jgi:hypothetical protein
MKKVTNYLYCLPAIFYVMFSVLAGEWLPVRWPADYKVGEITVTALSAGSLIIAMIIAALDESVDKKIKNLGGDE